MWADVARSTTGNDLDAAEIARANPGVAYPIIAGTLLQIPVDPLIPLVEDDGQVSIRVGGVKLETYDDFGLAVMSDAIVKGGFTVPNEPEMRALFRPLAAPEITIDLMGKRVLTGRAASPIAANQADRRTLGINCYSKAGILEEVSPPLSAFPLEYLNANLVAIAQDLCRYHAIPATFQGPTGGLFERVDIAPGEGTLGFLSGLAAQRSLVTTSDEKGGLLFWTGETPGAPMSRFERGTPTVDELSVQIDESLFYSSVTGTVPPKSRGRKLKKDVGVSYTVQNPFATDLVRPYTFEARDISPGDLEPAVNSTAGRMFAGIFSASLTTPTWMSDTRELFTRGRTVLLKSPEDYIDDFYEFLIAGVVFSKASNVYKASLSLVIPGAFSGAMPKRLPWR